MLNIKNIKLAVKPGELCAYDLLGLVQQLLVISGGNQLDKRIKKILEECNLEPGKVGMDYKKPPIPVPGGYGGVDGWIFVVTATFLSHFAFSWMGFNPTDEGYTLSVGRRILSGEVPFRDFVIIRPPGSFLVHIPWLLIGGDSVIWLSRMGAWFEFAVVSWCWVLVIEKLMAGRWNALTRISAGITAFCLTVHTFPVMAWHSIDAMFFSATGLALCSGAVRGGKLAGYLLLGLAVMCRQNFLPLVPVTLAIFGDWKYARYWYSSAFAGMAVLGWLWLGGAIGPALRQLTAHTGLGLPGIYIYFYDPLFTVALQAGFWGICLVRGAAVAGKEERSAKYSAWVGAALLLVISVPAVLMMGEILKTVISSRAMFGVASGAMLGLLMVPRDGKMAVRSAMLMLAGSVFLYWGGPNVLLDLTIILLAGGLAWRYLVGRLPRVTVGMGIYRGGILVLLYAWCVSISLGYSSPALASGPLAVFLFALVPAVDPGNRFIKVRGLFMGIFAIASLAMFIFVRHQVVYRDLPASRLTVPLDGILAGASHIRTNPNTAGYLEDLNLAVKKAGSGEFCILPDMACYWGRSPRRNPLPVDWADGAHTSIDGNPSLFSLTTTRLESRRGTITIILERVRADWLAGGFYPLEEGPEYPIVGYVRHNFRLVGRTKYFDLYR